MKKQLANFILTTTLLFSVNLFIDAQIFYKGADLGYLNEIEACAGPIYKENNVQKDVYAILADNGANIIRLRIFHTRENGWSTYADVKNAAIRAKAKGLAIILDFHYSDEWSDPGRQCTPEAWLPVDNNYAVLADSLYNYTYSVLDDMKKSNLTPDFVQVGNETNGGMCYSGCSVEWPNPWDKQTLLYNAGIQACRDVDPNIKIILHESDPAHAEWWAGELFSNNVTDFDIVGMSHYPCWHSASIEDLQSIIPNIKNIYNKDVLIVETSVSWTDGWMDNQPNGFTCVPDRYKSNPNTKPSPEIASQWCIDLADAIYASGGLGLVYWGGEWVATQIEGCPSYEYSDIFGGSSWENNTLFDFNYNLLDPGPIDFIQKAYNEGSSQEYDITVNTRGSSGKEIIKLIVDETEIASWKLSKTLKGYTASTSLSGEIKIVFANDRRGLDVQVDNIEVDGTILQAENQPTNTGVWRDNSCGGSYSEWLHCNGYISFGNVKTGNIGLGDKSPADNAIKLFPNPAATYINLDFPNEPLSPIIVNIYNTTGASVKNLQLNLKSNTINISNLEKGMYFIAVNTGANQELYKFIKE